MEFDQGRCPAIGSLAGVEAPAPEVMRAGNYAGTDAVSNPGAIDVIANLGRDTYQVACLHADASRVGGMDPHRVGVRDLVEPLSIA
jgi:hypothetical protein